MDRISVIVPVYNVENYLGKCVDSLLCQTVPPFEIILVDDGSTDSSGAMCDSYAREHPELVRVIHQENAGLGGARDTGIGAAEGNWLLFIDSDDYVAENAISRLTEAIGLGSDIIIFGFTEIGEDGTVFSVENDGYPDGTVLDFSESPEVVFIKPNAWNKLYRRSLFTETGILFPSRVWYEDIRTTVKLSASAGKVAFITDPLYYYLRRSGSIMNNANIVRNAEIIDAFDDLLGWFREKGLFEKYYD
ncbi:MAG: glycosyltransferase, partial [Oscillospiraceae bacterium]|nr:glycosyltransferase [Oscillospiraceae bacterium]